MPPLEVPVRRTGSPRGRETRIQLPACSRNEHAGSRKQLAQLASIDRQGGSTRPRVVLDREACGAKQPVSVGRRARPVAPSLSSVASRARATAAPSLRSLANPPAASQRAAALKRSNLRRRARLHDRP